MAAATFTFLAAGSGSGGTFTSGTITPTADSSHLLVLPCLEHSPTPSITSVKYAGTNLLQRKSVIQGANLSEIWALDDPLSVAADGTVVVVFSGGSDYHFIGSVVGAAAGAPETVGLAQNASSASMAIAITTIAANALVITGGSVAVDTDMSATSPHTQPTPDVGQDATARFAIGEQTQVSPGAITPTYTWSGATRNCGAAVSFAPLAVGGLLRHPGMSGGMNEMLGGLRG